MVLRGRGLAGRELREGPVNVAPDAESTRIRFAGLPGSSPDGCCPNGSAVRRRRQRSGVRQECSSNPTRTSRSSSEWLALDIGKAEVLCCIRLPAADGGKQRVQEVSTHSTMVPSLCELANRLVELGVTRVVMEATSDYWRPPFYLFEAHGLDPWLVNAKDVKHLPGRTKTDRLDAVWLCKVAERGMLRPSFVPPAAISAGCGT